MKTSRIATVLIIFLGSFILSGCTAYHLRKGNEGYKSMAYQDAIDHYEKILEEKENPKVMTKLARAYKETNKTRKAEEIYAKIVELPDTNPDHWKEYAEVLRSNEKYSKASEWYSKYLKLKPEDENALVGLHSCDSTTVFKRDSFMYSVQAMDLPTQGSVFLPVLYENGIVYTTEDSRNKKPNINPWTGRPYLDLYFAPLEGPSFGTPEPLSGSLNSKYHDGPAAFNPSGDTIYFTRSNLEGRMITRSDKDENNLMLYRGVKKNGKWKEIEKMPFNDDDYSTGHPAITPDGKHLIFISDRPGGYGGTDLYISELKNGEWTEPKNLGQKVNSSGDEMFPSFGYTGGEIRVYYASNGFPGLGGLDIYYSVWSSPFSKPRYLSYPINTPGDDFGLMLFPGTKNGFFASNRGNEDGVDKIYRFSTHEQNFLVNGSIVDKKTKVQLDAARIILKEKDTQKEKAGITREGGRFSFELEKGHDYLLTANHKEYIPDSIEFSTKGLRKSKTFQIRIELDRLPIKEPIAISPVYYDFDKYNSRSDAAQGLDQLARILEKKSGIEIELSAHCDSRGTDAYNMWLSKKRALSAMNYLIDKGVDSNRMTPKWYGERRLVNHCSDGVKCTQKEHLMNRRTEFQVVNLEQPGPIIGRINK